MREQKTQKKSLFVYYYWDAVFSCVVSSSAQHPAVSGNHSGSYSRSPVQPSAIHSMAAAPSRSRHPPGEQSVRMTLPLSAALLYPFSYPVQPFLLTVTACSLSILLSCTRHCSTAQQQPVGKMKSHVLSRLPASQLASLDSPISRPKVQ